MNRVVVTSRSFGQVSEEPMNLLLQEGLAVDRVNESGLLNEHQFKNLIASYDGMIIGADLLTAAVLKDASRLKIICKHGTGVDNIDLQKARELGIPVTNVPGMNADAVADATIGLMLDVARKLSYAARRVREGKWERIIGTDVGGKTLGILGFGAVGRRVAKRALGFGMRILVFDPFLTTLPEEMEGCTKVTLDELLSAADFVTVHVPLSGETKYLLNATRMAQMKQGAILINTSRGGIVDEDALYKSILRGHLAGAGLDVLEHEPAIGNPLLELDNVTIIPHIASYSVEAINAVSMVCARNIVKALRGLTPDYIVN